MNGFLGRLATRINRWRHSRGFGVHSPSAFLLMTEVIRPSRLYGLYSYYHLDCLLERLSEPSAMLLRARERMRVLLRLCCHLSPSTLRITADNTATPLTAMLLGKLPRLSGVSESVKDTPGLWVIAGNTNHMDVRLRQGVEAALGHGSSIVLLDEATAMSEPLFAAMAGGIRIELKDMVILRPLASSARASYNA